MLIMPAIDLINGKCVRLTKGDFNSTKVYNDDPVGLLNSFANIGAKLVHIVDLDGAKQGSSSQADLIAKLAGNHNLSIQVGGGIRNSMQIEKFLSIGVKRVVLGSICITNKVLVKELLAQFGQEKIVLALDCEFNNLAIPMVKTHGWQNDSGISVWDMLDFYTEAKYLLCTDISVDGTLQGPNLELYKQIKQRYPHIHIIASGGVSSEHDLDKLRALDLYGVVVGKAMYEGKINMEQVLKC